MALSKILGSETEYGLMVQKDPEFDSIATSLLLVNSYNPDQSLKLLWDYDQEDPLVDARGFELDEEYDVPDQHDNMAINKILPNGARFYVDHAHPEFSTPDLRLTVRLSNSRVPLSRINSFRRLACSTQCMPLHTKGSAIRGHASERFITKNFSLSFYSIATRSWLRSEARCSTIECKCSTLGLMATMSPDHAMQL